MSDRRGSGIDGTEVWNDSLLGHYLWTSGNVGEAVPSVMTPATWSLVGTMAPPPLGPHPVTGNIGGRFYLNLSASLAMASAVGLGDRVSKANELTFGTLPAGTTVPPLPMSRAEILASTARVAGPLLRDAVTLRRRLPELAARNVSHCRDLRRRIGGAVTADDLRSLWETDVRGLLHDVCPVFDAGARTIGDGRTDRELARLVGAEDARTLLSGMHGADGDLASLGPVLGLAQVKSGTLAPGAYVDLWGHRGPDEFEVSVPRPAEDPAWLERRLDTLTDPGPLLEERARAREAARRRLVAAHPRAARRWSRRLAQAAERGRAREQARSEFVRAFWVFRAFYLRAGDLTGQGEDVFFLPVDELVAVLGGDEAPFSAVTRRRAAFDRYRALPPLPTVIIGAFAPEAWACDPNRRTDVYDATSRSTQVGRGQSVSTARTVTGFPGSAGIVDGVARVVADVGEAQALQPGEILVAVTTNVGWTPLFPQARAVVTDVGAPLSHAAIVARELAIPAVVGCGDATALITTGDRLRVDGSAGTVELLP